MGHTRMTFFALLIALVCPIKASAQVAPAPAPQVIEELECRMQESMPGWKRERVEPFSKTERVVIAFWSNCGRRVKVAANYFASEAEAANVPWQPGRKAMEGLGDEAYAWGYSDNIGMRKGSLVFSISTEVLTSLPGVDAGESSALWRAEAVALNKGFARMISTLLSRPNIKCGETFERFH